MNEQEKQLLFKDLCARLPYGVQYKDAHDYKKTLDIWSHEFHTALNTILYDGKPSLYLRPMSSMTEEEKREYYETMGKYTHRLYPNSADFSEHTEYSWTAKTLDWLNAHHFDYRGLIEKGLALEAPEGMYN